MDHCHKYVIRYNYFSYVAGMCCVSDQPKNVGHVLIGICIVLPDLQKKGSSVFLHFNCQLFYEIIILIFFVYKSATILHNFLIAMNHLHQLSLNYIRCMFTYQ